MCSDPRPPPSPDWQRRRDCDGAGLDTPHWRAIHDDRGRLVVAINYNMDIGDAWEEADVPEYPAEATGLAYRFAINSIIYAMTH